MQLNQKGFSLIEGLLVVIALTLIVGVSFYVIKANKDAEDVKPETSQSSVEEPKKEEKKYLEVPELGVKVPISEGIKNIRYKVSQGSGDIYKFYDTEIAAQVSACRLGGAKMDDYRVYEIFKNEGQYSSKRDAGDTSGVLKQFDDFYVGYIGQPNFSPCTDKDGVSVENDQITTSIEKIQENLAEAFKQAEKL